jgi:hypothetical protein
MEGLFHLHSDYSFDGKLSLEELKEECLRRKQDFMVVTEHAEDFDTEKLRRYLDHCKRLTDREFIVVPGLEYRMEGKREVHLLVVGTEALDSVRTPQDVMEKALSEDGRCLVVLAHPSRNGHYMPEHLARRIHGIEIWNAAYDSRYLPDYRAIRLFRSLKKRNKNLVGFGGLDLHDRSGIRELKLQMRHPCRTEAELLTHLKAGRFSIRGPYAGIDSVPDWGFVKMLLLNVGRKLLAVADILKWKLAPPAKST